MNRFKENIRLFGQVFVMVYVIVAVLLMLVYSIPDNLDPPDRRWSDAVPGILFVLAPLASLVIVVGVALVDYWRKPQDITWDDY
jgi:hypothetical protein